MKNLLTAILLCFVLFVAMIPSAFAADGNYSDCMAVIAEQKEIQAQAHATAEALRKQGHDDSSAYIQVARSVWNEAQETMEAYWNLSKFTDEDIRILTTSVYYEAGQTSEELRQYVAQVVVNRVYDSRFPDTVYGVVTQPGQYNTKYATQGATQYILNRDAQNGTYYYQLCESAAKQAMMGLVDMPANVVYQANFSQGYAVWKSVHFDSGWFASTSYFCYG